MADVRPNFQQVQLAFAAHLRDPAQHPAPAGLEDRRLQVYRELFYNNIQNFLANGFPVLRSLYGDADWHALARDFYSRHQSHSPLFGEISAEFLNYLEHERGANPADPPFALELAHWEWVEGELAVSLEENPVSGFDPDGDLLAGLPVLTPLLRVLGYRYPVHRIGPSFRPEDPPEQLTWLAAYRGLDDRVGFLELNATTAALLERLRTNPTLSGGEQLSLLAQEMKHPNPQSVVDYGKSLLEDLRGRGVVLGTRAG